jgi:hypothetical protein
MRLDQRQQLFHQEGKHLDSFSASYSVICFMIRVFSNGGVEHNQKARRTRMLYGTTLVRSFYTKRTTRDWNYVVCRRMWPAYVEKDYLRYGTIFEAHTIWSGSACLGVVT